MRSPEERRQAKDTILEIAHKEKLQEEGDFQRGKRGIDCTDCQEVKERRKTEKPLDLAMRRLLITLE